jgi:hypothetical protein
LHTQTHIGLLNCPLKYKKGEGQTNTKISKEANIVYINQIEEEQVKAMVNHILKFNPDLIITEKGIFRSTVCAITPLLLPMLSGTLLTHT